MIDLKILQENPERIKEEVGKRGLSIDVNEIVSLDSRRRSLLVEIEGLRAERNKVSQEIPGLSPEERRRKIEDMREISAKLKDFEPILRETEEKLNLLLAQLPNFSHSSVPVGKDSSDNVIHHLWGKKPEFDFEPRTHEEIGELLDLVDTERASRVSGSRFGYLKNEAALLEFTLVRYALDLLIPKGFVPMVPPVLVKEEAMFGTGFFPAEETEYYATRLDDLHLVGTAEVPLCAYHMGEILEKEDLPLRYTGFSTCFRREAGTYGKDLGGIFRVHQFDKVEIFIFSEPDSSWEEYELLRETMEEIMKGLGFHYRVMNMCTGDIGLPNAKKYDLEVWFPGQAMYRELVSCSHDTDFQSRRLNIRYRDNGKIRFVHTMNSTACAVGRTLIAILENYQQADGTVLIPEILQPYLDGEKTIPFLPRKRS
ncbi:seryl-tRNA synthetase [Candidatus Hakubella thermalkaliphila]|uniref:Serine--tRNA ligase n=2 Tax=Candidatus Hakubella thermalkaliphila TaxID=2754717 RepID=A0A6V8PAR1_9ACTN|nr:serine--tRNA ligase [Candidatus Hakubella thermalkaliphila]MBT9171486.1 Serine--tRNA ligase [Actinomycetota bacterium]GFP21607.1 seryl-tRNA synthetase [Candidatus Hakubella thermalkaliphila]GFP29433.1 seryl-tRNA synthetase [Candidatus Hakubella thermalkaliphila]GFP42631.1 seryl-tRNA synthetase [Candidatus Hakubella thermalkaliphila]